MEEKHKILHGRKELVLGEIIPLCRSVILPGGLFYVIGTLQSNFL